MAQTHVASATPNLYLALEAKGPPVLGETNLGAHIGEIQLTSFSTSVAMVASDNGIGKAPIRPYDAVGCGKFTVTKALDAASPQLFIDVASATMLNGARITFETVSSSSAYDFLTIDLGPLYVVQISQSDPKDGTPTETIVLQTTRFRYTYFLPQKGGSKSPVSVGFDCHSHSAF